MSGKSTRLRDRVTRKTVIEARRSIPRESWLLIISIAREQKF